MSSKECSLSSFTLAKMLFYPPGSRKKKRKKKKRKKERKTKGLAGFLTPGGSSQPQNLVQKLENCEATRKRKKAHYDIALFYSFKVYTILLHKLY